MRGFEKIWKESAMANLNVLSLHSVGYTEESPERSYSG
jgi:hypothetical protein